MGSPNNELYVLKPKTPQAAAYHETSFNPKIMHKLDEINSLPIAIMVCGPDLKDVNNKLSKKRAEVINALRELGHDVWTGEEICLELGAKDEQNHHEKKPDNIYEIMGAETAELVVILQASPGSIAETHDFLQNKTVATKTYLYLDEAHKNGYSATGLVKMHEKTENKVHYYKDPDDLDECQLKTIIINLADNIRTAKWLRSNNVG